MKLSFRLCGNNEVIIKNVLENNVIIFGQKLGKAYVFQYWESAVFRYFIKKEIASYKNRMVTVTV